jgi:predicted Zn-dependent peptidase
MNLCVRAPHPSTTHSGGVLSGLVSAGLCVLIACEVASAAPPIIKSERLTNGVRLVCIHFPSSTNATLFTFSPMGLAADGPNQTQWSHLVEHLVIRSTVASDLSIANAETLPDHMRLDFYGTTNNWKDGLSHVKRWLKGVPFTEKSLSGEKPKVSQEVDYTVKNFATHKFAMAAWAQAVRHGQTHAAVHGDINRAGLSEIQAYRDAHFPVLSNIVLCVVGGLPPEQVLETASIQLGSLTSSAQPSAALKLHPGSHEVSWDLNARHLVLSWPIPSDAAAGACLMTVANWLNMQFFSDAELKKLAGMTLVGAGLKTPEGNFFYVSSSLRPGHSFQEVRQHIEKYLLKLKSPEADFSWAPAFGQQQAEAFATLPDPVALRAQLPPSMTPAMLEGNLGLQWGMNEFRYGARKPDLVRSLSGLNPDQVQQCVMKWLSDSNSIVVTLRPDSHD